VASTSERRRQLARQRWERQQARRAEEAARARRRRKVLAVFTAAVVVAGGIVAALQWAPWADDDTTVTDDTPPAASCTYAEAETPNAEIGLPPDTATAAGTARLTINGQPVDLQLLPDVAPCTVSSLVHLSGQGYFDGTTCHRLTTSATLKVLQCGDPTGSGGGGPGYEFGLEKTEGATYAAGTVAMAHRSGEPESNGSQFFLVYGDSQLPPEYTVFGQITAGLEVLTGIAAAGTADGAEDGAPKAPVTLESVVTGA
jgi:peptidyl-prolyl cis-trans isomerase B (cyclophilin B)